MKQRITADDILQLSSEQQEKLRDWWEPYLYEEVVSPKGHTFYFTNTADYSIRNLKSEGCLPLLSIGQLIQLLIKLQPYEDWECQFMFSENLCDELWVLVKRIL